MNEGCDKLAPTGAGVAKREPQVVQAVSYQSTVVNNLQEVVEKMEARLSNVLRETHKPEPVPTQERETVVILANQIQEANDRIQGVIDRIGSIFDRLEL